jgi:lactoylglutathione lyase
MRFAYTGIRVSNLERSLRFYTKIMGMKEIGRGRMDHGGIYVALKGPRSTQKLELNYYPRGTKFHERYKSGSELDHLAFWVKDVDKTHKKLLAKGAKNVVKPFSQDQYRLAFINDPDGIWIELLGIRRRKSIQ